MQHMIKHSDSNILLGPVHTHTHTHWADPSPLSPLPLHQGRTSESKSTDGGDSEW